LLGAARTAGGSGPPGGCWAAAMLLPIRIRGQGHHDSIRGYRWKENSVVEGMSSSRRQSTKGPSPVGMSTKDAGVLAAAGATDDTIIAEIAATSLCGD
jgi:hypothetical protein